MTGREAQVYLGRTGSLSGCGCPWPLEVVVQDVRQVFDRIDFAVSPAGGNGIPYVWVEAGRVAFKKED